MSTANRRELYMPSPVFYGIVLLTVIFAIALAQGYRGATMFLFVVAGWILSLTLHEFGHAMVAFVGGDRSVVEKGYLTLDVRKYVDVGTSLLFPIFFLVIGGIGLPGGAVWINTGAIRSPIMRSLMSAAGPAASGLCALICLLPIRFGLIDVSFGEVGLGLGLAFLGWIQIIALVLNLLPIPGLDGFGILEPHLSRSTLRAIQPYRQYGMLAVFGALIFVPSVGQAFFGFTNGVTNLIGGFEGFDVRGQGFFEFQFWRRI